MSPSLAGRRIGLLTMSASRLGGGLFEVVVAQAALLRALGAHPIVFALSDRFTQADRDRFGDTPVITCLPLGPRSVGYAPALARRMAAARLDLLHVHGIWTMTTRSALQWARRSGQGLIISPHGMLDPWITARSPIKKGLARLIYEEASWRQARFMHALCESESQNIAEVSGRRDSIIIPNEGPPATDHGDTERAPRVLYIGRIHEKKNLAGLIDGWTLARRPEGAELVIAGWGEAAALTDLERRIAAAEAGIRFVGPVFGEEKQQHLASARFAILPSFSEGLPMAILEAWACGLPTLMSSHCHLPEGFAAGAALPCGCTPAEIATALERALWLDAGPWRAMSNAALQLARGPFSSAAVSAAWRDAYAVALATDTPARIAKTAR